MNGRLASFKMSCFYRYLVSFDL